MSEDLRAIVQQLLEWVGDLRERVAALELGTQPEVIADRAPMSNAERARRYRNNKKTVTGTVTTSVTNVTKNVTKRHDERDGRNSSSESSSSDSSAEEKNEDKKQDSKSSAPLQLFSEPASRARARAANDLEPALGGEETVTASVTNVTKNVTAVVTRGVTETVTQAAWRVYAEQHGKRYPSPKPPPRSAKVNGQVAQFCSRIPADEHAATIEHYVWSQNARYIAAGHTWGPLLQDAEKLCTEARTGRMGTAHAARREDKQADRETEIAAMLTRLRAEDEEDERAALAVKGA